MGKRLPGDLVCAACGLAAGAHLVALSAFEAAHPHRTENRPAIVGIALPVEPDHDHAERGAFALLGVRRDLGGERMGPFWSGDDSESFWSGDDSRRFWSLTSATA